MRRSFLPCLVLVGAFVAQAAHASTLYLPRQFNASELATVGLAFTNPTLTEASFTFRLRTAQGAVLTTTQRTIGAKSQLAVRLSELFPAVSVASWFSADVDVDQVSGFWLTGDFSTAYDGARLLTASEAFPSPSFIFLGRTSEISFVNIGAATLTGSLNLVNANGTEVGSVPFQIPSLGVFQRSVTSLFPAQAGSFDTAGYRINTNVSDPAARILGTTVTPNAGDDNLVTNANSVSFGQGVFPHVVAGQAGASIYDSVLTLAAFRSTPTVTLTLRQSSGAVSTVQRTIPLNGVLRSGIASLFGLSAFGGLSVEGWLEVNGGSGSVAGFITYTDTRSGGTTAVEMQPSNAGDTNLLFGHIADLLPWWTGIALLNPSTTNALVEVYALDSAGKLIGGPVQSPGAAFTLPARSRRAFLLSELVPATQNRTGDGGYIFIRTTNAVQIHGIQLFFQRSGRVFANVPATRLTEAGIGFLPAPAPPTPASTVVVEEAFLGDANNRLIASFAPCSTVTINMRINNPTARTVNVTRQYRAAGPNGYTLHMSSAVREQPQGRSSAFFVTVAVPCDAPAGTYTVSGSVDYNGVISTATQTVTASGTGSGGTGTSGGGVTILSANPIVCTVRVGVGYDCTGSMTVRNDSATLAGTAFTATTFPSPAISGHAALPALGSAITVNFSASVAACPPVQTRVDFFADNQGNSAVPFATVSQTIPVSCQ